MKYIISMLIHATRLICHELYHSNITTISRTRWFTYRELYDSECVSMSWWYTSFKCSYKRRDSSVTNYIIQIPQTRWFTYRKLFDSEWVSMSRWNTRLTRCNTPNESRSSIIKKTIHDRFHWKCHTPETHHIQKLKFLDTNSSKIIIQIQPTSQFEFVSQGTEKSEFLDLVDFGMWRL